MDFRFTAAQEAWRDEVREFIKASYTPELDAEVKESVAWEATGPAAKEFIRKLGEKRWLAGNWPVEYGGLGLSTVDYYILQDEMAYWGVPSTGLTVTSVGPTIMRVGTEEQKRKWLPGMRTGDIMMNIGYSEPDAGTDLANLRCRAVLDGDEFVINGQKIWNSFAHWATHSWTACRTDPNVPKHKGVSTIIVPMDHPGVTIRPLYTLGDLRTNEVFFDNVRVPRENLIGDMNRGWYYVMMALDFERIFPAGGHMRTFSELLRYCKETRLNGTTLAKDPVIRHRLAELAMETEVLKMLVYRIAWLIDKGIVPNYEASMLKVYASEAGQRMFDVGMQIQGLYGQLERHSKWAPIYGRLEMAYRGSPVGRFGGGTNEIQRNIIAQRGFGLPR